MKRIKLKNNENFDPLYTQSKFKRIYRKQDESYNLEQLTQSPLRRKVENDAQQNLEDISAHQTIELITNLDRNKERAQSVMEDTDFGGWKENKEIWQFTNRYNMSQNNQKKQKSCQNQKMMQFKIRQPSPKIIENKIVNKIIQYPLQGYLEKSMNSFFGKAKYYKIIQNITGMGNRKTSKKSHYSSGNNSRAQSSLSFQL